MAYNFCKSRDWKMSSANPSIFTYGYKALRQRMFQTGLAEDLTKNIFHLKYMVQGINGGHEDAGDFENIQKLK